ncbi:hypothetical protein GGI43DRAFT_382853 [Trichoderma evansii]
MCEAHEPHELIMRLTMETTTTSSESTSQRSPGRRTPRRKTEKRNRGTPSQSRGATPRSSPSRYSASPRKTVYTPIKRGDEDGEGPLVSNRTLADMQMTKSNYLGKSGSEWVQAEEQLFEILYLRQDIPLLPLHWEVDFRGVPISGDCFCCNKGENPIIYAHTSTFLATTALMRLIDLTACVRTACQSGLRRKTPLMVKKALDKFIRWASEDGGYNHLQYTPNVIVEIIDGNAEGYDPTGFIKARMTALAKSHRKLLAINQDVTENMDIDKEVEMQIKSEAEASDEKQRQLFKERGRSWGMLGSRIISKLLGLMRFRPIIKPESHGETKMIDSEDDEQTTVEKCKQTADRVNVKMEEDEKPIIKMECYDGFEDDISMKDIPIAPTALSSSQLLPSPLTFRRSPPVIYGFFILSTTVLLFTADSTKYDLSMNPNYYLDMNFQDQGQSVWNALTVAIVACLARDDMMTRMEDFEEERIVDESDVDA